MVLAAASGQVDSGLDSKVDSKWIFWTLKIQPESSKKSTLESC